MAIISINNLPQIPIIYYIAPQDWAVPMLGNAPKIAKIVDKILAIFPEEANYFKQKNIDVTWVGHPLIDRMATSLDKETARKLLEINPRKNYQSRYYLHLVNKK